MLYLSKKKKRLNSKKKVVTKYNYKEKERYIVQYKAVNNVKCILKKIYKK